MHRIAHKGVVGRIVDVNAMVAILIADVSNDKIMGRLVGNPPASDLINIDPTVLVAIGNIVDNRVVAAARSLDPGCIGLDKRVVGK